MFGAWWLLSKYLLKKERRGGRKEKRRGKVGDNVRNTMQASEMVAGTLRDQKRKFQYPLEKKTFEWYLQIKMEDEGIIAKRNSMR